MWTFIFHGKWDFAHVIKVETIMVYLGGPNHKSLKLEKIGGRMGKNKRWKKWGKKNFTHASCCWLWRQTCPGTKGWVWPLETERNPQLTASKEMGTSVLQPQGTEFSQQPEWARKQTFPDTFRKGPILARHLEFSPLRATSDFWSP